MKFTANFSQATIETRFPMEVGEKDWLISIVDVGAADARVAQPFDKVFRFCFDDCEHTTQWDTAMSPAQAQRMGFVIARARDLDKNVWVHCHAGIYRSGAVVEVLNLLGWTVVNDFSIPRIPNRRVFNLLREEFPELGNFP